MVKCPNCDAPMESMSYYNEEFWHCPECGAGIFRCSECGQIRSTEDGVTVHHYGEHYNETMLLCNTCLSANWHSCSDCDELFPLDALNDDWRCPQCAREHAQNIDKGITSIADYHSGRESDIYYPHLCKGERGECPDHPRLFGIELEVDCADEGGSTEDASEFDCGALSHWAQDMDVIHFEHDGSLSDYGVEIITQPCSLRYHQECVGWSKLCKAVTEQGYSSHYQDGCGLHIHVNRGSMSVMDIVKADVFANRAMALFSQLGRREEFYSSRYLTKRIAMLGVACQSQDLYDLHKKGMPRDMAAKYTSFSYGRYTAVNTTNPDTVEFRFMKGSLNPNTVLGTIEMVDGICEYMKYIPLSEIYATEKNIKGYLDFMFAHKDKYTSFPAMAGRLVKSGSCAKIVRKLLNKDASCYDLRQVQNHGREV